MVIRCARGHARRAQFILPCPSPQSGFVDPIYAYAHTILGANVDSAIIGGSFYTGSSYPPQYQNTLFLADFVQGWVRYLTYDAGNNSWDDTLFATGGEAIVGLKTGTAGDLFYLTLSEEGVAASEIRRIRYQPDVNQSPVGPNQCRSVKWSPQYCLHLLRRWFV